MKIVFLAMVIFGEAALPMRARGAPETFAARLAPHHALASVKSTDGETLPGQGVERLADGEINPTCAWRWQKKPIRVVFDLGEAREVGGVRLTSGRSWVNCGIKTASFYGDDGQPLAEHLAFRPANTYRDNYAIWKPVVCRRVTMVIEDTYDFNPNYYSGYTHAATPLLPKIFETPPYPEFSGKFPTVQIAEMAFFGKEPPDDLPLPNKEGSIAYPESRLVRDWLYQSCAVSNISHLANVEPDTTKPDPLGEDLSSVLKAAACGRAGARPSRMGSHHLGGCLSPAFLSDRAARRREFLAAFRKDFTQFIYVKHIVMGNSIFHATDDLTDASYQEWKSVPDYTVGGSQLVLATIREDGAVSQEVLIEKPHGYIRDPNLHFDGKTLVFSMRDNLTTSNYHLFTLDLETHALKQLTFDGLVRASDMPGGPRSCEAVKMAAPHTGGPRSCAAAIDFPMPCSDIEPCWLPDGSIVFQSTRCSHSVDCWPLPSASTRCRRSSRS